MQTWRHVATELAGPGGVIREGVLDERGRSIAVEIVVPGALLRVSREAEGDPWRGLAYPLPEVRLVRSLELAGWRVVDEVMDETTYVVAQDPGGTIWAIGVAADEDMRGYLEGDMAFEERAERFAFVDLMDTRSPHDLMAALMADDG